jgi:hypothetical protein
LNPLQISGFDRGKMLLVQDQFSRFVAVRRRRRLSILLFLFFRFIVPCLSTPYGMMFEDNLKTNATTNEIE